MFLKEIKVKNFRSLKNVSVFLDDQTVLIGENNSGKTAFLDAVRFALSKTTGRNPYDEYDYYMDQNLSSPKESDGISVILRFEEKEAEEWDGYIMDTFGEAIQYMNDDDEKGSIILRSYSVYNKATGDFEYRTVFLNNQYEELPAKIQNKLYSFLKLIPVFYLQALRDIKETFSSKSALWGRFIKRASIPAESLKDIQEQIESLNKSIISGDENLSKLVEALDRIQKVLNFNGTDLVSINAMPLKSWDLLSRAQVVLNNGDNSFNLPLERHGQGTQSVTTILLFRAYIELLVKELESKEAAAILTLEEPEAHLHPQAVRALEKSLREIPCQKIITTHSPFFIQNMDLRNVRFMQKKNGETVVKQLVTEIVFTPVEIPDGMRKVAEKFPNVFSIDESKIVIKESLSPQLIRCFEGSFKKKGIDVTGIIANSSEIFTEQELNQLNTYVQKTRGEILFARKWLLYEGQTEDVVVPYCADLMGKNLDEYGVSTIMYRNNGSAKAFIKLALVLGIDWYLLGDNDQQGQSTLQEVRNCGVDETELCNRATLTTEVDFEHEIAADSNILPDYERIVAAEIDEQTKQLKEAGKNKEYYSKIAELIQTSKVDTAYELISIWSQRKMKKEEIPVFITNLVEKVCK